MKKLLWLLISFLGIPSSVQSQISPEEIQFIRQGVQRLIFDEEQSITMAKIEPKNIIINNATPKRRNVFCNPLLKFNNGNLAYGTRLTIKKERANIKGSSKLG